MDWRTWMALCWDWMLILCWFICTFSRWHRYLSFSFLIIDLFDVVENRLSGMYRNLNRRRKEMVSNENILNKKMSGEVYVIDVVEWFFLLVDHEEPYCVRITARFVWISKDIKWNLYPISKLPKKAIFPPKLAVNISRCTRPRYPESRMTVRDVMHALKERRMSAVRALAAFGKSLKLYMIIRTPRIRKVCRRTQDHRVRFGNLLMLLQYPNESPLLTTLRCCEAVVPRHWWRN